MYGNQPCDITSEVAKSHGRLITGLSVGKDSFNFRFDDDHELDV
jgi:hypothetical protein